MNKGKEFEHRFYNNWISSMPGSFILRLYDTTNGYLGIQNPCDYVCFTNKKLFVITELKKIVEMVIKVGKRPLQGTKLFVKIARSLSRGESIILQPITPAALQPNPMHIVKHCLPWQQAFLNKWSKLKATLGRYPKSSSKVNKGKNMAIGGSITDITHARVLYIP